MTEEQAIKKLEELGYIRESFFNVRDVTARYECTDDEAMQVLENVFNDVSGINERIDIEAGLLGISEKEFD